MAIIDAGMGGKEAHIDKSKITESDGGRERGGVQGWKVQTYQNINSCSGHCADADSAGRLGN